LSYCICKFREIVHSQAKDVASDAESVLKLGIQTDILKKSSSACTWLGIKRKLFGRGERGLGH
jgi:hypothetical protein